MLIAREKSCFILIVRTTNNLQYCYTIECAPQLELSDLFELHGGWFGTGLAVFKADGYKKNPRANDWAKWCSSAHTLVVK